nr:MAG TPA: crossover junction endodeoxyribonuclease [Caudoviricetes sp.]
MLEFFIEGRLPTLNEYTKVSRGNKYASARMKLNAENLILQCISNTVTGQVKPPYFIEFHWFENSRRRDKDNVCFAKKFILDALQKGNYIENDNNKYIKGFTDLFSYGKVQGVAVKIRGLENE